MPRFRYTATSADGRPQAGEIEAVSADDAYLRLTVRGFRSVVVEAADAPSNVAAVGDARDALPVLEEAGAEDVVAAELVHETVYWRAPREPVARPAEPQKLSAEDARQLAEQLAILARGGLPLAPGLRAAAAEMPSHRLAKALVWLADQLDAGRPLDQVLDAESRFMPDHVRCLIIAGVRSGRLVETLDELVDIDRTSRELARGMRLALAYPLLLAALFATLFVVIEVMVVPDMLKVYEDFDIPFPWRVRALFWLSGERMLIAAGIVITAVPMLYLVVRASIPASARRGLVAWIPLYGAAAFWRAVASWLRLLALTLDHGVPAPEALRLASEGVEDANVRIAGQRAARAAMAGRTVGDAVWVARFPTSLAPLVSWGESAGALPEALRSGAQMLEDRVRLRAAVLRTALPPIVFVLVAVGSLILFATLLMPLVNVIESLT